MPPLATGRFETFGSTHLLLLGLFVVGVVVAVVGGRRQRGRDAGVRTGRVLSVVLLCIAVPGHVYELTPADYDLGSSLPFQLCDLGWVAAAWALWTRARIPTGLTYYWGLTLTVQDIVTPSLGQQFPDPRFFVFWGTHLLAVWAAVYLTFGLGIAPRWREYRVTVAVTAVWALMAFCFNQAAGTDYGYVNRKPPSASLLDWFGPWPVYVLVSLALLVLGWALITWPWAHVEERRRRAG